MMRLTISLVAVFAMTAALMTTGGCAGTVEPGVSANFGTIHAQLPAQPEEVVKATRAALSNMNLILISANSSQMSGRVIARTSEDKPVTVNIESASNKVSKVAIKVGGYGDEKMGLAVLRSIQDELNKMKGGQAMSPAAEGQMLGIQR